MFLGLLSLALLGTPDSGSARPSLLTAPRPGRPEACHLPHAARGRAPDSRRRRFGDYLDDDDDPDSAGRARTAAPTAVLPPPSTLPSTAHTFLHRAGLTRRLAAVSLVYALCTLRI